MLIFFCFKGEIIDGQSTGNSFHSVANKRAYNKKLTSQVILLLPILTSSFSLEKTVEEKQKDLHCVTL